MVKWIDKAKLHAPKAPISMEEAVSAIRKHGVYAKQMDITYAAGNYPEGTLVLMADSAGPLVDFMKAWDKKK